MAIAVGFASPILANLLIYWTSSDVFSRAEITLRAITGVPLHTAVTLGSLLIYRKILKEKEREQGSPPTISAHGGKSTSNPSGRGQSQNAAAPVDDSAFFLVATEEVESDNQDRALWAKSMALADGDRAKAKYEYIRRRAEQLAQREDTEAEVVVEDDKPWESVPVTEFCQMASVPEATVIAMIREGIYDGKMIDGQWVIAKKEFQRSKLGD